MHLIKPLLEQYKIPALCETGSAGGASARAAAGLFQKIWTIELIPDRVVSDGNFPNITWLTGHSVDHLHRIVEELNRERQEEKRYILFYLDAHYSDPVINTSSYKECYLIEEIEVVANYHDALVIIDDARLFMGPPPHPNDARDWPGIQDIFINLRQHFPAHYSTIVDDYIISVPVEMKDVIDSEWRANYNVRYPDTASKLKTQVKGAYDAFLNYLK